MNGDNKTTKHTNAQTDKDEALVAAENTAVTDKAMDDIDQPGDTAEPQSSKTKGIALLISVLLLALVTIGALAWYGWVYHLQPQQQRLQALEQSLNNQLELSDRLDARQKSVAEASTVTAEQLAGLQNDQQLIEQRIESHANRLRNLSGTSRDDWMLAEAKYLLRLASQRLLMERGTVGAQALLESVDEILATIDDVDLFIVRDAVAKDIIALKLAPNVDREGIYLKLAALISAVEQLPSIPPLAEQTSVSPLTNEPESPADELADQTWYLQLLTELKSLFSELGQFVKIRHHDQPPEPLLSDQYQARLTHNLRLVFEQAQLALLREQSTIYEQSLQQARQWLEQYFAHYPQKDILVREINDLRQQSIVQVLPDISSSLKELVNYIDRYHKLTPEQATVAETIDDEEIAAERPLVPPASIESKGVTPRDEEENTQ